MNTNLPMLPHRAYPEPGAHGADFVKSLKHALLEGAVDWEEAMNLFYIPGVGFHQSGYYLLCHSVGYLACGSHTVAVTPLMQDLLSHTSLAGVMAQDLAMPHQTIYFALPDSKFQLWGGANTGWHDCAGVYVSATCSDNTKTEVDVLKFYFWGIENERSSCEGDDASFWLDINLSKMLEAGWDFDTAINDVLGNPDNEVKMREVTPHGVQDMSRDDGKHIKDIHRLARLVLNALLYLSCEDAVVEDDPQAAAHRKEAAELAAAYSRIKNKSKGKARRIQKRLSAIPRDHILWIGDSATTASDQPIVREGSWWPRKDILRNKLREMRDDPEAVERSNCLDEAEKRMQDAAEVEDIAQCVREIRNQRKWFVARLGLAEELAESLEATRRWIRPRRKSKKGG